MTGRWCYLYRAIDSTDATIDLLLSALRDAATAKRLFRRTCFGSFATGTLCQLSCKAKLIDCKGLADYGGRPA